MSNKTLRMGSRGSELALTQSRWVQRRLQEQLPDWQVTLQVIKTSGDRIIDRPLPEIGGKGLFTKEIEEALLRDEIDIAVHSLKDLPKIMPDGLTLAAISEREDPRDVLVSKGGGRFSELVPGARVGTGSLRRLAQLAHCRRDLKFLPIRGNVDTRLRKLQTGEYDAVVMAAAGLKRIGRADAITEYFGDDICVSAAGQGALAIETRVDGAARAIAACLNDLNSRAEVMAERALLDRLGGGCHVPVGARARVEAGRLKIIGVVAALGGNPIYREEQCADIHCPEQLGIATAEALLGRGAAELLGV